MQAVTTPWLVPRQASAQEGHLPSAREGVVKEGPQRAWHAL